MFNCKSSNEEAGEESSSSGSSQSETIWVLRDDAKPATTSCLKSSKLGEQASTNSRKCVHYAPFLAQGKFKFCLFATHISANCRISWWCLLLIKTKKGTKKKVSI